MIDFLSRFFVWAFCICFLGLIVFLNLSFGFLYGYSVFFLIVFIASFGWHLRGMYDFRQWLKRGVYCDDCAPLVDRSKDQGGNK